MTRVLLVDDQELVREGIRVIVDAQDDLEVVGELPDGTGVVDAVRACSPDVVVMDVRMPRVNGIDATKQLRDAGFQRVAVLVLTTFDLDEYVFEALRAGANGFLLKDSPRRRLVEAIRVLAEGAALLDPEMTRRLIGTFVSTPRLARPPGLDQLSSREHEVLLALARGLSNAEIAAALVVAEATVKTHVASVLRKLDLRDRTHAVVLAYEAGLVVPGERGASG